MTENSKRSKTEDDDEEVREENKKFMNFKITKVMKAKKRALIQKSSVIIIH